MSARHDDNDGSDIFWPGYVDATTNLILNLLFLLTILMVAVFMFALELGRSSQVKSVEQAEAPTQQEAEVVSVAIDPVKENIALKREIERLNTLLAQRLPQEEPAGGKVETVEATSPVPKPTTGLDKTFAGEAEVMVRFTDEAVAFSSAEQDQLRESLQPIVSSGQASIYVQVPAGFSEARRMGFYRAMAVRNLLLEMKLPKEKITVAVVEGNRKANPALVRVRSL